MKYKISELKGALLDAAVAKAAEFPLDSDGDRLDERTNGGAPSPFHPSTDWMQGGPIIERKRIIVFPPERRGAWGAYVRPRFRFGDLHDYDGKGEGKTILIAAMRAYVASKFGEEVELP